MKGMASQGKHSESIITAQSLRMAFTVRRKGMGLLREKVTVTALDGIDLSVRRGELLGYIGPNGAGKSTTVKCLCGILKPTAGRIIVDGCEPYRDRIRHVKQLGVVFGQRTQLWWDLPVIDSFKLLKDIYGLDTAMYSQSLEELSGVLEIEGLLTTPVRQLSLGQRMRCDIAASLLHRPPLLLLDEPTIGLDAISKLQVRAFLKHLNAERGTTILITTHDMDDIEALCTRVLMINDGRILLDGGVETLRAAAGDGRVLVAELDRPFANGRLPGGALITSNEGGRVRIAFDRKQVRVEEVIAALSPFGINDMELSQPPIEEAVKRLYERGGVS